MLIYVPLVWIRDLEKLAWSHLVGDVVILTVITVICVYSGIEIGDVGKVEMNPAFTPLFFKAIPYSAFAFEGVAVVLPLREIVEDHKGFFSLSCKVIGTICIAYILFCEYTNLAWGANMEDFTLITQSLPATSFIAYFLKGLYSVNLFFSYPLQLSPAVNLMEGFIFSTNTPQTKKRYWQQNLFRTIFVGFTISIAILVFSQISVFIEVLAAATCSPLAFTLPALFHYKLKGGNKLHLVIAIVTTALTIFMVVQAIYELIKDLTE